MGNNAKAPYSSAWGNLVRKSGPFPLRGVYAIFSGEILLYVGHSFNLRARIHSHGYRSRFLSHNADRIITRSMNDPILCVALEKYVIWRMRPSLNRRVVHSDSLRKEYESLARTIYRDYSRDWRKAKKEKSQ